MEPQNIDIRWKQRFQNYENAYLRLKEGTLMLGHDPANQAVTSEICGRYLPMLSQFYDDFKARL